MTYTIQGGTILPVNKKLTTTDPTVIVNGGPSGAIVVAVYAAEISGNTPTLALYKTSGGVNVYLRGARAMTAYEEYSRDLIIRLKANETLVAVAGAADQIDINATYIPGDSTAKGM